MSDYFVAVLQGRAWFDRVLLASIVLSCVLLGWRLGRIFW